MSTDIQTKRSIIAIIAWWELRRILYNVVVWIGIMLSLSIIGALIEVPEGEDIQEPITIFFFIILCNLCYTLGWISELFNRKDRDYGPKLFKIGLTFTLFWVFLPALIHIGWWVKRGFTIYHFD